MSGMDEKYHTPKQTPSVTERRRRRKESAIPGTSNSPIVINVGMGDDEKDVEIAKLNSIVKQQADMISDIKSQQDKMNESKLIDTSNKISEQAANIHEHEITLMASALEETRSQLSKAKETLTAAETAKRNSVESNERLQSRLREKDEEIESLNQDKIRLKKQVNSLREQEEVYISRLDEMRRKNEGALTELETKLTMTEKEVKTEKRRRMELDEKMEELKEKLRKMETRVVEYDENGCTTSTELTPLSVPVITSPETPRKTNQLARRVSIVNIVQNSNYAHSMEEAHERIGALSVQCNYQQRENQQLKKELEETECRAESARMDLAALQLKMTQSEWNSDQAHKYLYEEHEKTKHQKAELRGELLKVQRECAVLKQQLEMKSSMSSEEGDSLKKEVRRVKEESDRLKDEVERLKKEKEREESAVQQMTAKAVEAERRVGELEEKVMEIQEAKDRLADVSSSKSELEARMEKMMRTNRHLNEAMQVLDEQAEELMDKKQKVEERLKSVEAEYSSLRAQLQSAQDATVAKTSDYAEVVAERDRLKIKVHFLNQELKETHTDYKEELANLAREICEKKKVENKESQANAQLSLMQSEKSRLENDMKNERRRVESLQSEVKALERQMNSLRENEKRLQDENGKLRGGLNDSVAKIEMYKRQCETAGEEMGSVKEQLKKEKEKAQMMEEEISILEDTIKEKERLAAYLQSQTNAKHMPKVSRKSTLLRQPSMESCMTGEITIVDERELMELENKKQELFRKLELKKHELSGRKEEVSISSSSSIPQKTSSTGRIPLSPVVNRQTVGTMRHEIPHRWKAQLGFGVRQLKCAACFDGIPRVRYAQRCIECGVVVHSECSSRVSGTCGIPEKCASFYLDTHSIPSSTMNGWLRVYTDDSSLSTGKWESAWARLDGGRLSLFDNDCLAENDGRPILDLDLANNTWTMRAVADAPNAEREGLNCLHINMNGRNLYLHAQTANSRARWIEALKSAQRARHDAVRRPSQSMAASSMLFGLEAPANLNINASYCMEDWILIGCQEGLFVTSLSNPRAPFAVAGITAIYALEGAEDIGMLACVCGPHRTLALLSLNQLRAEMTVHQPTARPHILTQLDHIHLIMYTKVGSERYLASCNSTEINILRYNDKLDTFVAHETLSTNEPAMCLTPSPSGFFFGSDSFYSCNLEQTPVRVKSLASSHLADFPIAILPISDRELLLAYQNHGRFVSPDGILTRSEQVEWEQMPLEFCYMAPYVYMVSMNGMEILRVQPYSSPSTPAFHTEKEYVRMNGTGSHIVGKRSNGDVYLSLTTPSLTELHSINAAQKRSVMKRKGSATTSDRSIVKKMGL